MDDRLYQQDDDGVISEGAEAAMDGCTRSSTGEIDLSKWKPKPPDLSDISGWRGHWIYISSVLERDIASEIGKEKKDTIAILGTSGAVSAKHVESDIGVEGYGLPTNPRETLALCKVVKAIVARTVQLRGIDSQRGGGAEATGGVSERELFEVLNLLRSEIPDKVEQNVKIKELEAEITKLKVENEKLKETAKLSVFYDHFDRLCRQYPRD